MRFEVYPRQFHPQIVPDSFVEGSDILKVNVRNVDNIQGARKDFYHTTVQQVRRLRLTACHLSHWSLFQAIYVRI